MTEKLYRYERNATWEDDPQIVLRELEVLRKTKTGVWVNNWGKPKFVSLLSGGRWARIKKKDARRNFYKRAEKCVWILRAQLARAEEFLELARAEGYNVGGEDD